MVVDAFGVVAMVAMTPLIANRFWGYITNRNPKRQRRQTLSAHLTLRMTISSHFDGRR